MTLRSKQNSNEFSPIVALEFKGWIQANRYKSEANSKKLCSKKYKATQERTSRRSINFKSTFRCCVTLYFLKQTAQAHSMGRLRGGDCATTRHKRELIIGFERLAKRRKKRKGVRQYKIRLSISPDYLKQRVYIDAEISHKQRVYELFQSVKRVR